ncbi:MAG: hypothetical protein LBC53_03160 [Spirochaetaceae bacterium]|jgi:hypothetical protein|nr:hypothetical protein [Spirochaetaceae bacterium]
MKNALFFGVFFLRCAALALYCQESSVIDALKKSPGADGAGPQKDAGTAENGDFDESEFDSLEFDKNYSGPNVGVVYDGRSSSGYFVVDGENEYKEYHYLEQIRYDDLLFVLTDTLSRLTKEGFRWASAPKLEVFDEKLPESEVAFIYEIDKKNDAVNARVQFPDFKISITALKTRNAAHRYDASSGKDMFNLINSFAYRINEVESVLGMDNIEYAMRYFKKEADGGAEATGTATAAAERGVEEATPATEEAAAATRRVFSRLTDVKAASKDKPVKNITLTLELYYEDAPDKEAYLKEKLPALRRFAQKYINTKTAAALTEDSNKAALELAELMNAFELEDEIIKEIIFVKINID